MTPAQLIAATKAVFDELTRDEQLIPPLFRGMIPQEKVQPLAAKLAKIALDAAQAAAPTPEQSK